MHSHFNLVINLYLSNYQTFQISKQVPVFLKKKSKLFLSREVQIRFFPQFHRSVGTMEMRRLSINVDKGQNNQFDSDNCGKITTIYIIHKCIIDFVTDPGAPLQ